MADTILVINGGSSSIKFQLFDLGDGPDGLDRQLKGQLDGIGTHPRLRATDSRGNALVDQTFDPAEVGNARQGIARLGAWLGDRLGGTLPSAIGHRVVHGGPFFEAPVLVDDAMLDRLEELVPLAPLHQPGNLAPIRAIRAQLPDIPQVACFDTAFHRGHPELADRFALPEELYRVGVRRYGFHGLSYEYIARTLPREAPDIAEGRVVVAHLGSGASMCAIHNGRSIDSTMGFTALDGLPMGTRPGQLDAGVVLYLLTRKGMDARAIEHMFYHDSGLKGLSGFSNDMRDLLASDDPRARLAVDYFVYRIAGFLGSLTAALGGLDGLVFTAGIGERAAPVRAAVCRRSAWLGIDLDEAANAANAPRISTPASRVEVRIIPTDEERMIALHTKKLLWSAS